MLKESRRPSPSPAIEVDFISTDSRIISVIITAGVRCSCYTWQAGADLCS